MIEKGLIIDDLVELRWCRGSVQCLLICTECASTVKWHTVAVKNGELEGAEWWKEAGNLPSVFSGFYTGRVQREPLNSTPGCEKHV